MVFPLIFAGVSTAMSVGSTISGFLGGQQAAKASAAQAAATNKANAEYRDAVMRYQNETWEQDLRYAQESLGYQRAEFDRQLEWSEKARESVTRNRDAEAFTLMARGIEETIASTFQSQALGKQGRAARATYAAKDRGVEGNSVEAVLGDVWRQEGEAQTIVDMNRDVTGRQLFREAIASDAQHDSQMSQIASSIRTYAPNAPIRTPGPVNPVNPQSGTTAPSMGALAGSLAGNLVGGFNTYNGLTGSKANETYDQLSSWVGRQFSFGGS
nr:hypothetical protein [uncultured Roseococcus sp.]